MLPADLAILVRDYPNICAIKEATGDLLNMARTREFCGPDVAIFSGDDGLTLMMMEESAIKATGVISVMGNVAPGAIAQMVDLARQGKAFEASALEKALRPLFDVITVKTDEQSSFGPVLCRARNPLPLKTLMSLLGMPSSPCRSPLGLMTKQGFERVLGAARTVWAKNPEILQPAADFFKLDLDERLHRPPESWAEILYYKNAY
ncbi:MAG: dihydrodipicolinate synthase family protein [Patescibacteria group bacterium]|nr:dihydrodipicolinate synthase family protein [Patescibacteria group bacterium]MDD4611333.1 dihydrodipicolinate synthase family protein [Patescibacteria group bacterium]